MLKSGPLMRCCDVRDLTAMHILLLIVEHIPVQWAISTHSDEDVDQHGVGRVWSQNSGTQRRKVRSFQLTVNMGTEEVSFNDEWHNKTIKGPFYWHGLTYTSTWISNHMTDKMWDKIIDPFPNFKGCTWIGYVISSHILRLYFPRRP